MNAQSPKSLTYVPIRRLLLDDANPRFARSHVGESQAALAVRLEMAFDAFTVAESIKKCGFFLSEPLVVIRHPQSEALIVVEGNRRLTALLGLADHSIRSQFEDADRWNALVDGDGEVLSLESEVPVVIMESRDACATLIGRRHISGILAWSPLAQARFIARLLQEGKSVAEVHEQVGLEPSKISALSRDYAIAIHAKELGVDTGEIEQAFSLLQVAMGNTKLREFVGAPLGSKYVIGKDPVDPKRRDALREVLGFIFGSEQRQPVIGESRDISKLASVVASEEGLRALRAGETLDAAKQRVDDSKVDPRERLLKRLSAAKNALIASSDDISGFHDDPQVRSMIEEVAECLHNLEGPAA
jgi:hypothetical protein